MLPQTCCPDPELQDLLKAWFTGAHIIIQYLLLLVETHNEIQHY